VSSIMLLPYWVIPFTNNDSVSQRCMGRVITGISHFVSVFVCLSAYSFSKRKQARAINIKLGRHTVHGSCLAYIDSEVIRSKIKVTHAVIKCAVGLGVQLCMLIGMLLRLFSYNLFSFMWPRYSGMMFLGFSGA